VLTPAAFVGPILTVLMCCYMVLMYIHVYCAAFCRNKRIMRCKLQSMRTQYKIHITDISVTM